MSETVYPNGPVKRPKSLKDKFDNLYPGINKAELKKNYKYDPDDGRVYRYTKKRGWEVCKREGRNITTCYVTQVDGVMIRIPYLAWLLYHGDWPKEEIVAIDGSLFNTSMDNLELKSQHVKQLGHYSILPVVERRFGEFEAKVWHKPYFYRSNTFKSYAQAKRWAEKELRLYNKYAYPTEAAAKNTSDDRPLPAVGVYDHRVRTDLYLVRVKVNGKWQHYSYEKNIEDAIEAQLKGQAEVNEIWADEAEEQRANEERTQAQLKANVLKGWAVIEANRKVKREEVLKDD